MLGAGCWARVLGAGRRGWGSMEDVWGMSSSLTCWFCDAQWGQLHGVRTTMGAAALAAAGYGLHCLLTRK